MKAPLQSLSDRQQRFLCKVSAYAVAGAAMGEAGSSAAIVHTDFGPLGVTIADGSFELDLNGDRIEDFELSHLFTTTAASSYDFAIAQIAGARAPNAVFATMTGTYPSSRSVPRAFPLGSMISSQLSAIPDGNLAFYLGDVFHPFRSGEFRSGQRAYVGLVFEIPESGMHLGWAHLQVINLRRVQLYGFAYETEPEHSIVAGAVPEPPSLVLLAAGALGLAALRQRRPKHDLS